MPEINMAELKEKIDKAKEQKAKAEGQIEQIMETWKKEYGCNTIEEVREYQKNIETKIQTLDEKLEGVTKEIEAILNENVD